MGARPGRHRAQSERDQALSISPAVWSVARQRLARRREDHEVEEAGAEAEDGAVEIEKPLVLADRRAKHLREVLWRHLAHARGDEVADGGGLALVELGIAERGHRVVDGLGRDRLADRVVL